VLILISPAKSLDYESTTHQQNFTIPYFAKDTEKLALQLKKFSVSDLEKLMGISKKLAELNFERFQKFLPKFDLKNSKQALLVFDGDVYGPIEKDKFSQADFDFAQKNLRILSGFYGILKPLDLMQPYRLEMGTDFKKTSLEKNLKIKNLYQFWGDKISQYLNLEKSEYLINLASEEYFSAINAKKISAKIINIIFKEKKSGIYKIIGINAKKARGLMVNFIIKNKIDDIAKIKKFNLENYIFEKSMSDESNLVFVR
jgi:cytoplasmic iron level regulating protein YaaA (DUF328/UPF0246 family)